MRAEKLFSDAGLDPKKTAFSPSEIARALCVSGETVRAMTRSGHLEHFRIGGQIRIPRGAAFALVETHYVDGGAA